MVPQNKESFERRMVVIKDGVEITPVRWADDQTFPYNNFIYKVELSSPALAEHFTGSEQVWRRQPCTDLPPTEGVSTVIVRMSNPRAMGLNNTNRIENEVAAMHLARGAIAQLGSRYASLVPAVYAWKAAAGPHPVDETGFGWIVMEYLTGSPLHEQFKSFDMAEKKLIIPEIASIFSSIQRVELPPGVDCFGGFTINKEGNIISGQETIQGAPGGPWREYDEVWRHQMLCQLKEADANELIQGWRVHGIRERIEQFLNVTLRRVLQDAGVDMSKLGFVHFDFTMSNMLYDAEEKRISGIVDFDFAGVNNPAHEFFFTSLHDVHGTTREQKSDKLRRAILTGNFGASTEAGEEEHADAWELAKLWDEVMGERGGLRPRDIRGMTTLAKLNTLTDMLFPWQLGSVDMLRRQTREENAKMRARAEKAIDDMLSGWGV
ncbi:uncharacterized protein G6M90_00g071210 [Metarhizium brunneum]|uniref:Aminoglycoside phosphotransferase domain-containing protein n=1 Tax=Metarhizium brunneum TaxID=500148 RepID=A0A7D5YT95_9HYPO|nr:hypothetical protein G6M90_00g071210 [Metarhizium brunneum]